MTTHEAARLIRDALNANGHDATTLVGGKVCRIKVSYEGAPCGHIEIGSPKPFATILKNGGQISRIAEGAVKLTGRSAVELEVVDLGGKAAEPAMAPAMPRDENQAQARDDGESWVDQYGRRQRAGS